MVEAAMRDDAAYGWRAVGNALLEFGSTGRKSLEQMHAQAKDQWRAWIAYEVVYSVPKAAPGFNLIDRF
jgi:hypothetical protein